MRKSAVSIFSDHDKNALLDQFKTIVDAGEMRSDSDVRWDSAVSRLEQKYGLHLDDWKRIGRDQRGQKCDEGSGWYGLRGSCKRGKKALSNEEKTKLKKESRLGLADKIRAKKGMRDRNAPKPKKTTKGQTALNLARGDYGREGYLTTEVHTGWTNGYLAKLSPKEDKSLDRSFISASDKETSRAGNGQKHYELSSLDDGIYEAETVVRSGIKERHYLKIKDGAITNKFNNIDEAEDDEYPGLKEERKKLQGIKKQATAVEYGELTGSEKQVSWASSLREKGAKEVLDELSSFPDSPEKTKAIDSVNKFVSRQSASRDWIDNRSQLKSWIKKGASKEASRSDSTDIIRYTSAIDRINTKYGLNLHLDDWKRIGANQMGQKCGRGWVGLRGACERGKKGSDVNAAIRKSKQALAAKIRKRKGLSEIKDRDGRKDPIGYAFAPGNQKSSTMTARRTGPKSGMGGGGGRLGSIQRTEERRQQVQSGVFPGKTIGQRFEEADRIREKYSGPPITSRRLATRSEIDNAPVQIPNQRSSSEPRRRGRSVD